MSPQRAIRNRERHARRVHHEEFMVRRKAHGRQEQTVAFQWRDGAGELHYETLTPAQSWPFLNRDLAE